MVGMKKFQNTNEKGSVRYVVFEEGGVWYAVALEFNLIVEGKDKDDVFKELQDAIVGYLEAVRKSNTRPFALNQSPDKEYVNLWEANLTVQGLTTKRKDSGSKTKPEIHVANRGELALGLLV